MEIDITDFFNNAEPYDFSGSCAERGANAARETWENAMVEGGLRPILTTPEQLDAFRAHVKGFGAWGDHEVDGWNVQECNALFIQMVSGAMREAGAEGCTVDEFDWTQHAKDSEAGRVAGRFYRGDIQDHEGFGRVFYYLGD